MVENVDNPMTFKELANYYAKKQPHMVDDIINKAPILERIPFQPASHGLYNLYEEATNVEGPDFIDMNAPAPQMSIDSDLKKIDLSIMAGEMFCPEDKAQQMGGAEKYFAKHTPRFLRDAGQTTEKRIIYDNFRQYAIDNGKARNAGGTGTGYSIVAVRYIPGEVCGLYSPEGFKQGAMLDVKKVNGGNLYHNKNGVLGYGIRLKGYFGMMLANKKAVASIVNITPDNIPTEGMIDSLLLDVEQDGNTYLYMHPRTLNMLNKYKGDILRTTSSDKGIDRRISEWNGVEIVTSFNFLDGTEPHIDV